MHTTRYSPVRVVTPVLLPLLLHPRLLPPLLCIGVRALLQSLLPLRLRDVGGKRGPELVRALLLEWGKGVASATRPSSPLLMLRLLTCFLLGSSFGVTGLFVPLRGTTSSAFFFVLFAAAASTAARPPSLKSFLMASRRVLILDGGRGVTMSAKWCRRGRPLDAYPTHLL